MEIFNIPEWAKKFGVFGVIIFVVVFVISIFIEAVLQQESTSLWTDKIKPFLSMPIQINIAIPLWLMTVIVLTIVVLCVIYITWLKRLPNKKNGKINPQARPLPQKSGETMNQSRVFRAVKEARAQRLDYQDLATIIEQAVNTGTIKPEVGAEILKEFDFVLFLNVDKTYTVQKYRRQK